MNKTLRTSRIRSTITTVIVTMEGWMGRVNWQDWMPCFVLVKWQLHNQKVWWIGHACMLCFFYSVGGFVQTFAESMKLCMAFSLGVENPRLVPIGNDVHLWLWDRLCNARVERYIICDTLFYRTSGKLSWPYISLEGYMFGTFLWD